MPLSIQDLLTIQELPSTDELSLQTIAMFYEEHLCNRQFYYELKHKQQNLRLRFKQGDLCHLLGIQYVLKGRQFAGELGFQKLKKDILTFDSLIQANIGGFKTAQYRMLYFPFIYQLIHDPIVVMNHPNEPNRVQAMFTFYNKYTGRFVELKLRRESKNNPEFFVPVSFVELRKIEPRTRVEVTDKKILGYNDGYLSANT
ncbi:PBECR4 domain-containing protein [Paenibacillus sp. TH7-28]